MRGRSTRGVVVAAAFLMVAGCGGNANQAAQPSPAAESPTPGCADLTGDGPAEIIMLDHSFDPYCAMVSVEQELVFRNDGKVAHTYTLEDEGIELKLLAGDEGTAGVPGEVLGPGEHEYVCRLHGTMKGYLEIA